MRRMRLARRAATDAQSRRRGRLTTSRGRLHGHCGCMCLAWSPTKARTKCETRFRAHRAAWLGKAMREVWLPLAAAKVGRRRSPDLAKSDHSRAQS